MNPSTQYISGNIPTSHEPILVDEVHELALHIERGLESLEEAFAEFVTHSSRKADLKQGR